MKKLKKILAVIIAMAMVLTAMPVTSAFAEEVYDTLTLDTLKSVSYKGEDITLSFTPENDGYYKFMSTGSCDTTATLYDSEWNKLSFGDESSDSNFAIVEKLSGGSVYYLCVNEYYGDNANFKVKVTETVGIADATITKYPDNMTCIENYEYNASLKGLEMLFVTTEGEEVSWAYGTVPYIGDLRITYNDTFVGDDGYFHVNIKCGGFTTELKYEIVENPISSIEYISKHDIVLYDKTEGYYAYDDKFIYFYNLPSDATFVINYKDGTSIRCKENEGINGQQLHIYTDQYDEPWNVGTNYIYVSYMGVKTTIPVYVKATPIKSVTINSAPSREYVVGDYEYGYYDERNRYQFSPTDITDLSFTVEYYNGSKKTYDNSDFDVENQTIAGYPYRVDEYNANYEKTVNTTLYFMGAKIKYDVKVVKSPLKSFEMTWYPEKTDYEEGYYPVFDGTEFTLTFNDGTVETVVLSDENTSYGEDEWLDYEISVGDYKIKVYECWNQYDEKIYGFSCLDKWIEYEGVWFDKRRGIENIKVENFTPSADEMKLHIEYADGLTETLNLDTVNFSKSGNGYQVFSKTENGILNFRIGRIMENEKVTGYTVYVLGKEIVVDSSFESLGDVDGDGNITIMDATAIQLHIASLEKLSTKELSVADTDKDADVTILDASFVQLYVANMIEKF